MAVHGLAILLGRIKAGISNRGQFFFARACIKEASHSQVARMLQAEVVFRGWNRNKPKNCNLTKPCAKEGNKINLILGDPDAS